VLFANDRLIHPCRRSSFEIQPIVSKILLLFFRLFKLLFYFIPKFLPQNYIFLDVYLCSWILTSFCQFIPFLTKDDIFSKESDFSMFADQNFVLSSFLESLSRSPLIFSQNQCNLYFHDNIIWLFWTIGVDFLSGSLARHGLWICFIWSRFHNFWNKFIQLSKMNLWESSTLPTFKDKNESGGCYDIVLFHITILVVKLNVAFKTIRDNFSCQ